MTNAARLPASSRFYHTHTWTTDVPQRAPGLDARLFLFQSSRRSFGIASTRFFICLGLGFEIPFLRPQPVRSMYILCIDASNQGSTYHQTNNVFTAATPMAMPALSPGVKPCLNSLTLVRPQEIFLSFLGLTCGNRGLRGMRDTRRCRGDTCRG